MDEILARHKNEQKELQNEIMGLKKTISKGEKKKKKEVDAIIKQKQNDLLDKQEQELNAFEAAELKEMEDMMQELNTNQLNDNKDTNPKLNKNSEEKPNIITQEPTQTKKSKAQRRREKKEEDERLLKLQIEDECKGLVNYKELEEKAIKPQLDKLNMAVFEVPADGNCLYRAVVHQLKINEYFPRGIPETVATLRQITADTIRNQKNDYIPFMHTETGDMMNDEQFEMYCNKVANSSDWGGQIEIRAMSQGLNVQINVIQANAPVVVVGDSSESTLYIAYFRKAYGLGEHYNSLCPL